MVKGQGPLTTFDVTTVRQQRNDPINVQGQPIGPAYTPRPAATSTTGAGTGPKVV